THCINYSDTIFIRLIPNSDATGVCMFTSRDKIDGQTASLVALDIEINNNSNTAIKGDYFKLLYKNNQMADRAANNINDAFKIYGADLLSDQTYRLIFKIPEILNNFEVVYGDFTCGNIEV